MNPFSMRTRFSLSLLNSMILMIYLAGCLQSVSGGFSRDDQVSTAFRTGTVPTELTYFFTGRDTMPYAIMGVDPSYTVPSTYWIPFEPTPEQLRSMSSNIYGKDRYDPYGFSILAPDGAPIGIWFSNLRFPNVRVDQENRTIDVLYRNPELYDGY
jgi:hypothetical protein